MANENERNLLQKNAIFINQLPPEYEVEARNQFPLEHIHDSLHYNNGLYIYFNFESQALTYARTGAITIKGRRFKISLAVTSLTVHEVNTHLSYDELHNLMASNGYENIILGYYVELKVERYRVLTYYLSGAYRVILDIPEILHICDITPIVWPGSGNFEVSFFCRLCRQDGHRSFECSNFSLVESFTDKYECIPADAKEIKFGPFHIQSATTNITCKSAIPHFNHTSDASNSRSTTSEAHLNMTEHAGRPVEPGISRGILQAIRNVAPDNAQSWKVFLTHARRRRNRKLKEITLAHANHHSAGNVSVLIEQLHSIRDNYYSSVVIRGPGEDSDLKYINRLIEQLCKLFPQ